MDDDDYWLQVAVAASAQEAAMGQHWRQGPAPAAAPTANNNAGTNGAAVPLAQAGMQRSGSLVPPPGLAEVLSRKYWRSGR